MKMSVSKITVTSPAESFHCLLDRLIRCTGGEKGMIAQPGCGHSGRRPDDAFHLATVQNADTLIPFERLQNVVHVIAQVNHGRFYMRSFPYA